MCQACNAAVIDMLRAHAPSHPSMPTAQAMPFATRSERFVKSGSIYADTIFTGGRVITMNGASSRAEAVAVEDGRILATGSREEMAALQGSSTQIVNLDGRTLLPGLIDPHMHFVFVHFDDWIDVSPMQTPSYAEVLDKLRAAGRTIGPDDWVRAKLFDPSITRDARPPTLAELDEVAPNNPLFMMEGNGHIVYVNSRAYALAGVTSDTSDPPMSRICRDANGALSGRLEESPAFMPFMAKMPSLTAPELKTRVRRMMDGAAAVGCTALHDCGIGMLTGAGDLGLLQSVMAEDAPVRYRGMLVSTEMDTWEEMSLRPGHGDDQFRVDGIKAWSDGSNQAKTGYQREPYLGGEGRGALNYTLEQLTEAIVRGHNGGWQLGVHANGDAAIDTTIDAYEAALKNSPRDDHRHRIEHCSVLHPDQIERMRALGLSPSFLIGHVRWWGKAFRDRLLGSERANFYDPCASALKGGLRISLHSDFNVTPIEPLRCIENAVTRIMNEGGEVLNADERIPVEAALRAMTINAAWQCRMDDIVGSIEPTKCADFTILEEDPTEVDPERISRIKVSETWVDGKLRFGA